ncbi:MAG: cold shock domain-containing protein [Leucobacter sp.]|nr:cold shock domain-containing protein [Leucobacter sp.]
MPSGKVRFYNDEKGFGFIQGDDGQEVFLHASVLPPDAEVRQGTRLEYGVAEGKRGPQALSVRLLETPKMAKRNRKSADDMALIIEDLVKLLDGMGERLKQGHYPERAQSRQIATMLRRVADDFDV